MEFRICTTWRRSPVAGACRALAGLGRCAMAAGNATQAEVQLRHAHQIFKLIGAPDAEDVLAELDAVTSLGSVQ